MQINTREELLLSVKAVDHAVFYIIIFLVLIIIIGMVYGTMGTNILTLGFSVLLYITKRRTNTLRKDIERLYPS